MVPQLLLAAAVHHLTVFVSVLEKEAGQVLGGNGQFIIIVHHVALSNDRLVLRAA